MNDDSLLQEDKPICISNHLPPIQRIALQPLGDCEKSYYHAVAKKGNSYNELLFTIFHFISILTKGNIKEHENTKHVSPNKSTKDIPKLESFRPTEEIQNYRQLMEILNPYHNSKKDLLITIADIVNTLEQARDLLQNIAFDTTRVSQSVACIRTPLDEINYTFEKIQQS